MNFTHYNVHTQTAFILTTCNWCRGQMCEEGSTEILAQQPAKTKIFDGTKTPALSNYTNDKYCCTACDGKPYYVEPIKSEFAIIRRPDGAYVDSRKTARAAQKLVDEMNGDNTSPVADTSLTSSTTEAKLGDHVVIRLGGDINGDFPRGTHLEIPTNTLLQFFIDNEVHPMADKQTRQTAKDVIRSLIEKKKTDAQILEIVLKQFPESNATPKHCTKYRRELFLEGGETTPELAAVGSPQHQEWAKANLADAKKGPHKDYWKAWEIKQKAATKAKADAEKAKVAKKKAADKAKADAAKAAKAKAKPAAKAKAKPAAKAKATKGDDLLS